MNELLRFDQAAGRTLILLSVAMARLGPTFMLVPFLGGRLMGGFTRNAMAFVVALFLTPWLAAHAPDDLADFSGLLPIIAKEAMLGVLFGFLSSLAFQAASGVGFLVDNQRGLSMTQTEDPTTGASTSPLGGLALETLIMIFIATGGLALFFQAVVTSYAFWPPFSFWPAWPAEGLKQLLLSQFAWFFSAVVTLAFPMVLVCFLVDFGMGLMNRFAPQLNVFFLAMPVKSALSLAVMAVYWAAMFKVLGGEVLRLPVLWDALRHVLT